MKVVLLLSGGIDSPVAAYLLAKEHDLVLLHMDNRPFTDDSEVEKVKKLADQIRKSSGKAMPLYFSPHGYHAQANIGKYTTPRYQCVLCRRAMLKTAEKLAEKLGADAIGTGESLGQVASQTLKNMAVEEESTSLPILRPLLGMDKTQIMDISREIDTYELSILPGICCTLAPKKPSVKAELKHILAEEAKMDVDTMVEELASGIEEIS